MKYFLITALSAMLLTACVTSKKTGKLDYISVSDTETKVLKGIISRAVLEGDPAFAWFKDNMQYGTADAYAVDMFKQKSEKFSVLVFAGTWCHFYQITCIIWVRGFVNRGTRFLQKPAG